MTETHDATPFLEPESGPDLLVDLPCKTGEGPIWDDRRNVLFWTDIPPGRIFRYDPATGANDLVYQHAHEVGGSTLQEDGSLLLFCSFGTILRLDPDTGDVSTVIERIDAEADSRFNDVEAAPDGSVLCGTMPSQDHVGRLYRLFPDGSLTLLFDDIGLSNGIGFSPDRRTMYHSDTSTRRIYALDYNPETAEISNRRILIGDPAGEGYPDGMTVDAEGTLWSARWDGRALYAYTPEGASIGRVKFPARKVSSIAFGGPDFATAFITTAAASGRDEFEGVLAGSLFSVDLGVKGVPPFRSNVAAPLG
ncbi:MAG: SMP-30/gluconolactonase/LRE family protein [Thermomicrobiales bacterium]